MLVLCLAGVAHSVYADEIIFKNGDRLTGKIAHVLEDKLVFKSDVIGTVTIDMSMIQKFSANGAIEVHLKDSNVLYQKIVSSKTSQPRLKLGITWYIVPP